MYETYGSKKGRAFRVNFGSYIVIIGLFLVCSMLDGLAVCVGNNTDLHFHLRKSDLERVSQVCW